MGVCERVTSLFSSTFLCLLLQLQGVGGLLLDLLSGLLILCRMHTQQSLKIMGVNLNIKTKMGDGLLDQERLHGLSY